MILYLLNYQMIKMMQKVKLLKFGKELKSRKQAQEIRIKLNCSKKIEFDAKGVYIVTHSFSDELFGFIFQKVGKENFLKNILFKNFSEEQIAVLKRVISLYIK